MAIYFTKIKNGYVTRVKFTHPWTIYGLVDVEGLRKKSLRQDTEQELNTHLMVVLNRAQ